jgi:pimeloyl-ACP methyl ester carboxylesterase
MEIKINHFAQKIIKTVEVISPYIAGIISFRMFCRAKPASLRKLEIDIMNKAQKEILRVNSLKVVTYTWGKGKPVLLVHGWESRASRFYLFVKELIKNGYQPISFDALGHGKSGGTTTTILEYKEIIDQIQSKYGAFEAIIAHSIGVLHVFYAIKNGIQTKSIVAVSGVCEYSYLTRKYSSLLKLHYKTEHYLNVKVERLFYPQANIWTAFSAHSEAEKVDSRICIIHDRNDEVVKVEQSKLLYSAYKDKAHVYFTDDLGHLRILTDLNVIKLSIKHIENLFVGNTING